MAFFGLFGLGEKKEKEPEEVIKKVPRDYAIEMHGIIAGLPPNEQDAALYMLIRIIHPDKHLHRDPIKKKTAVAGTADGTLTQPVNSVLTGNNATA